MLKKISAILATIAAVVLLPLVWPTIKYKGNLPQDFFKFPPEMTDYGAKAPFNIYIFIGFSIFCTFIILLYIFPQWFGFKKIKVVSELNLKKKAPFPVWFFFGVFLLIVSLIILWGKFSEPKILVNWALIPLFWSAVFVVDGLVYYRTIGKSIINTRPHTIIAIAVCSIGGWTYFEYLNFFVKENWYYPSGNLISTEQFIIYSLLGSTGLLTIVFEMYTLLKSFKHLAVKYSQGPKVNISRKTWKIIYVISLFIMLMISVLPDQLFFILWLGPLFALLAILSLQNTWTPFTPLAKGNWTPVALVCLAYLIQGFFYEGWNYFSAIHLEHNQVISYNPGFWMYSVPYVDKFHIFEMPILGYFGYLPFGLFCWVAWLVFANLLGIDHKFSDDEDADPTTVEI